MSDLFGFAAPLHAALDYHMERHTVLASNVAHVDTPGYKPIDLERVDRPEFAKLLQVEVARTNPAHMSQGGLTPVLEGKIFQDLSGGVGNDGNYVSLDREAAKVAANQLRYDVTSAILSAELRSMHFAASDGKG